MDDFEIEFLKDWKHIIFFYWGEQNMLSLSRYFLSLQILKRNLNLKIIKDKYMIYWNKTKHTMFF